MISCDLGDMKDGLFALFLLALNIRAILLVLVSRAAYTTVKQNPAANLKDEMSKTWIICLMKKKREGGFVGALLGPWSYSLLFHLFFYENIKISKSHIKANTDLVG